ncbi:MAG: sel1 repeat family protein [Sulfuritalea sp.]|nr:sel1 repeat family protein [Sulfuritalea sp.]
MTVFKSCRNSWQLAGLAFLIFAAGTSPASAGADEDYAAGMVQYERNDFTNAMPLMRKAADAGHIKAMIILATMLDAAEVDDQAAAYYRKAADAGSLDGVYGLATMYASGDGVKKDVQEARNLIIRAAEGGHQQATWVLAQAYIRGELGIPDDQRDGKDALKWITLAADKEFLPALEALEKAYRSGGYGLAPDIAKADELKLKINKHRGVTEKKPRRRGEKK